MHKRLCRSLWPCFEDGNRNSLDVHGAHHMLGLSQFFCHAQNHLLSPQSGVLIAEFQTTCSRSELHPHELHRNFGPLSAIPSQSEQVTSQVPLSSLKPAISWPTLQLQPGCYASHRPWSACKADWHLAIGSSVYNLQCSCWPGIW